ncbi:alpha-L-rhamnosidase-related protein [Pedobacter endophyticus]|uniref:Alpha-L-rhamnosidase N-terminal domain-containing protein n=1 Tax=Pedobacter endophyticus TaxID=2789740 RepID=A0A7U3Q512_9SPHI|nr:alpha-L-rhamnosidase C-terminal domain-containing protein [Pedobacter endophyticus]QPH38710.1 alpha-L-rhamnosidase N-terminal domain-containing protein [Pedobacter endophyticus]
MKPIPTYIIFFCLIIQAMCTKADPLNPKLMRESWPARWISFPEEGDNPNGLYHFRKEISMKSIPRQLWIHVSADSRYRLYINGKWISHGPAAGELRHWQFETINIAPFLNPGKNVIAAEVWNFGTQRPMAHHSYKTGLIIQEDAQDNLYGFTSDTSWKVCKNSGYSIMPKWSRGTDIGAAEMVDFEKYPSGWNSAEPDHELRWEKARQGERGETKWSVFNRPGRLLVPREIPAMRMEPIRFSSVRKSSGVEVSENHLQKKKTLRIPANTNVEWIIDQKELTNAYPVLEITSGKGSLINIGYAEALYDSSNKKGNRNDIEGKMFRGFQDGLKASGKAEAYMPLWFRTFRYIKLTIQTADQPLEISDFHAIKTEYPFDYNAKFKSEDKFLDSLLEVGWRTAKLCAVETYMDCPYYERLQYVGDTRIQGLVSLYNSGDDRLLRQAIKQFDQSRMSEGLTLSRFPTNYDQQIPPFSLWWIGMVNDYWMYRGDKKFVGGMMPGVRQVLSFFEQYQLEDGSLGAMPYWNFTDWSNHKGWVFGVPPNGQKGNSSLLDFQFLWALQIASGLESSLGRPELSQKYLNQAAKLSLTIKNKYWVASRGLFADEDTKGLFSQHANVLAILTHVVEGNQAKDLMEKILADDSIAQTTIYFRYYQMLALKEVGLADRYLDQLGVWKAHLNSGLTTWAEISDTQTTRSDCHAWGASPNIELYRIVLGIESDAPGFSRVRINPALGKLKHAEGSIPHPNGDLTVSYRKVGQRWNITVRLPEKVSGTFIWQGKTFELKPGQLNRLSM